MVKNINKPFSDIGKWDIAIFLGKFGITTFLSFEVKIYDNFQLLNQQMWNW